MSSFLDALKAAPESSRSKVNTFLASFQSQGQVVTIFLEGREDTSFFGYHVKRFAEHHSLLVGMIKLENKSDVLEAYDYLEKRFPNNPRIMFFVDKDHDELIGKSRGTRTQKGLFVTRYYSIENYLVLDESITAVLVDGWGLDPSNPAIGHARRHFQKFQKDYRNSLLPWMAWLISARRSGVKPNYNNVKLSILTVDDNYKTKIEWRPDMCSHLKRVCGGDIETDLDLEGIDAVIRDLEVLPTKSWLWGKLELRCLVAFLETLKREAEGCKVKLSIRINFTNIVEWLAPRLPCPPDLEDYLEDRLGNS